LRNLGLQGHWIKRPASQGRGRPKFQSCMTPFQEPLLLSSNEFTVELSVHMSIMKLHMNLYGWRGCVPKANSKGGYTPLEKRLRMLCWEATGFRMGCRYIDLHVSDYEG
jgi:hypothetical protein